jgi:hypothetical protein
MSQGLAELRRRKQELLLESEINREILRVEFCQLQIKAVEWKRGLLKARTAYNLVAPLAGAGLAFFFMRKRMNVGAKHNGNGRARSDKSAYLKILAPIGFAALRKAIGFWRHTRQRNGTA